MVRRVFCFVTAFLIASSMLAYGQSSPQARLTETDMKVLTDARLGIVKAALQLTPEQAQYWPSVEEAVRARAQAQYQRITAAAERLGQGREIDPIELLRSRADALAQRSAELKKIVDAWQPLYQSLSPDQKKRMRLVVQRVLPQVKDAVDTSRMEMYDEDSDDN